MTIDEKIIYTILLVVFAVAVYFTNHMKGTDSFSYGAMLPFFFNKDGTEKKFTKPFFITFFLIWIPILWVFG